MKIISATAGEMIHMGSGWGCLEQLRRKADGEHKPLSYWYDFPESTITGAQMPWYNLLRCGRLDSADPLAVPDGYLVDNKWLLRMEKAMERPENQSWFGWMHLGLMRYANGDVRGAMWAFDSSLALEPSPWVLRNLAMIHGNEYDNFKKAKEYMERSVQMEPNNRWLWIDMAVLCLKAGLYQYWVDLYFTIPENIRAEGRLKVYTAIALTHLGQLDEACAYLNHDLLVPDIKEDENLITEAWFALYGAIIAQKPGINNPDQLRKMVESEYPLGELDFRMH
jgi:tetratricopeptide (TPR) repeat protein